MAATVVLSGPNIDGKRALEVMRALAPLVVGRPLALVQTSSETLPDGNGASACWQATWSDGDVSVVAAVDNGDGNPRDGYGYSISVRLLGTWQGKPHWRASMSGGGYDPVLQSPLHLEFLDVGPDVFESLRARLKELLPQHSDVTFEDPYAVENILSDFAFNGNEAWARTFLAQPLLPTVRWASPRLCERKLALLGPDAVTARTWVTLEPGAALAWRALADAGGDEGTSVEDARWLAALAHPWGPDWLREAVTRGSEGESLRRAMAHVFSDGHWRSFSEEDQVALREDARWTEQRAPTERVHVTKVNGIPNDVEVDVMVASMVGFPVPAVKAQGGRSAVYGPPLAAPGNLPSTFGVGQGHGVRRSVVEPAGNVFESRALATCHVNCEDRLTCMGMIWLGPGRQVVWRSTLHLADGKPVHSGADVDILDAGDGAWGRRLADTFRSAPPRGWAAR